MSCKLNPVHSVIAAHSSDVKAVISAPYFGPVDDANNDADIKFSIITCSRDKHVKVFSIRRKGSNYETSETRSFSFHSNFVNSLVFKTPNCEFPNGMIFSGGSDKVIFAFDPTQSADSEPYRLLLGHSDNVSSLFLDGDTLISGSWDKTAIVWDQFKMPKHTLSGHQAAVWAVLILPNGNFLTASADKSIKMWKNEKCIKTMTGHTDAVRALCALPMAVGFASSSNDGTVRLWSDTGSCIRILSAAADFLYSVCQIQNGVNCTVAVGENGTVLQWQDVELIQNLHLPNTVSIWSVANCSSYADVPLLILGCSSGDLVFLSSIGNKIELHAPKGFDHEAMTIYEYSDLMLRRGTKEGQICVAKNNPNCGHKEAVSFAYEWKNAQWHLIGEVTSTASSSPPSTNTSQYDYEFSVDVHEDAPPLKLQMNRDDNPHQVASKFLAENDLPEAYHAQVVDFILKNTSANPLECRPQNPPVSVPQDRQKYHKITAINKSGIFKKLLALINDDERAVLEYLLEPAFLGGEPLNFAQVFWDLLERLPANEIFPLLDIIRNAPFNGDVFKKIIFKPNSSASLFEFLQTNLMAADEHFRSTNARLICRLLVNVFSFPKDSASCSIFSLYPNLTDKIIDTFVQVRPFLSSEPDKELPHLFMENFSMFLSAAPAPIANDLYPLIHRLAT
ncbi:hypothetical protein MDAP_000733 [Mitosporidium daphniae]